VLDGFLRDTGRWPDEYGVQTFHFRNMQKSASKEYPSSLTSMSNVAMVLCDQSKYEQAEEM
jgi:hypothetical protein